MVGIIACYSDVIARAVEFEAMLRQGAPVSGVHIRENLGRALAGAREAMAQAGRPRPEEEEATFAVVAWVDELFQNAPESEWGRSIEPFQSEMFGTRGAGNEFFRRLNKLGSESAGIIEVYYVALCLGFQGEFKLHPNGAVELRNLRERLSLQLPSRPPRLETLGEQKIYPQPYGVPDPGPARVPVNWRRIGLAALAALAALLVALVVWKILSAPRSAEQVLADGRALAAGYQCADLALEVDPDRNLKVSGHLASVGDRERLAGELRKIKDVNTVAVLAAVHIRPLCDVLATLKPYLQAGDAAKAPTVAVKSDIGPTKIGHRLIVDGRAGDADGNVYIDLYDPEGNVLHVLPNLVDKNTFRVARNRFTLGADASPGKRVFDLLEPPGEHLVTILAVDGVAPLFVKPRPEVEKAGDYLPALQEALAAAAKRAAVGAPLFFEVVR